MTQVLEHAKLEKVIGLLTDVAMSVVKAKEDGHFGLDDVQYFVPLLASVSPAIQALAGIGDEIKSLSIEDVMELVKSVLEKLGPVIDDKLASIIKQALICAVEAAKLIAVIKA